MGKIKVLVPSYLKEFDCIGRICEDSCCKEWDIPIDKSTYQKYKRLKNDKYKPILDSNIELNKERDNLYNYAKVKLKKSGRCPFFGKNRLCNIYTKLSYNYMPTMCKIYPRRINKIDDKFEMSLCLSCPQAAKNVLLSKDIMKFEYIELEFEEYMKLADKSFYTEKEELKKEEYRYFWDIRISSIAILQNRRFGIVERLMLLGMLYKRIEKCIKDKKYSNIPKKISEFMSDIDDYNNDMFPDITKNNEAQASISKIMFNERCIYKKNLSKKTVSFINGADLSFKNLVENEVLLDDFATLKYEIYMLHGVTPFIKENPHIFENYLVNCYFSYCMPFINNFENIWDALVYLCMQYLMVKIFMMGCYFNKDVIYDENKINEKDMVDIIYSIERDLKHKEYYNQFMLKAAEKLELNTLGGLYILIHH